MVPEVENAHLLPVGGGRLWARLEWWVGRPGTRDARLLGFRTDVPDTFSASDVFVLPSRREGLPRSVLEAMAAGKPAVATNVWGSRDLVEGGITGLLVRVGDGRGLAQTLIRLLRDGALRHRMGAAALVKVQAYSLDRVLAEMSAIYARYLPSARVLPTAPGTEHTLSV